MDDAVGVIPPRAISDTSPAGQAAPAAPASSASTPRIEPVVQAPQNVGHTVVAAGGIILIWALSLVHVSPPPEVAISFATLAGVGVTYLMQRMTK